MNVRNSSPWIFLFSNTTVLSSPPGFSFSAWIYIFLQCVILLILIVFFLVCGWQIIYNHMYCQPVNEFYCLHFPFLFLNVIIVDLHSTSSLLIELKTCTRRLSLRLDYSCLIYIQYILSFSALYFCHVLGHYGCNDETNTEGRDGGVPALSRSWAGILGGRRDSLTHIWWLKPKVMKQRQLQHKQQPASRTATRPGTWHNKSICVVVAGTSGFSSFHHDKQMNHDNMRNDR